MTKDSQITICQKDGKIAWIQREDVEKKIGVRFIVITRAEGPTKLCGISQTYGSFEDARKGLFRDNSTYPGPGQGYDKHDFVVYFEDGETYSGRLDVKKAECEDNDQDVRKHVRDFMLFYTGTKNPEWMSDKQYAQALSGVNCEEYKQFLEKYDV